MKTIYSILTAITLCCACSDNEPTYPSIVTEMTDAYSNAEGVLWSIVTDQGIRYTLLNPQQGFKPNQVYRTLSGFVPTPQGSATLYQLRGVHRLQDSTAVASSDPTAIISAWRAGKYINLHLAPKTQGGIQYWGFFRTADSRPGNTYIRLHHRQNADRPSYTEDLFASIPVDSIPGTQPGDTITLSVNTYGGLKTWTFKK